MDKLREKLASLESDRDADAVLAIVNEFLDEQGYETIGCGDCGNRGSSALVGWEQNLCERACSKPEGMRG